MLRFDPTSIRAWAKQGITEISCFTVSKGCAGKKIEIQEIHQAECDISLPLELGIRCWIRSTERAVFENSSITRTPKGWILKSDQISGRCGCSKSFSLKTEDAKADKIALFKLMMKQKKEGSHER